MAGSYLRRIEVGAVGGGQHDLRGALAVFGASTSYADQVLALAANSVSFVDGVPDGVATALA